MQHREGRDYNQIDRIAKTLSSCFDKAEGDNAKLASALTKLR